MRYSITLCGIRLFEIEVDPATGKVIGVWSLEGKEIPMTTGAHTRDRLFRELPELEEQEAIPRARRN